MDSIDARLTNWGLYHRYPRRISAYPPGPLARLYRGGRRGDAETPPCADVSDALLIDRGWKLCMHIDREVLRMHYIWNASPPFICRRLKLTGRTPQFRSARISQSCRLMARVVRLSMTFRSARISQSCRLDDSTLLPTTAVPVSAHFPIV